MRTSNPTHGTTGLQDSSNTAVASFFLFFFCWVTDGAARLRNYTDLYTPEYLLASSECSHSHFSTRIYTLIRYARGHRIGYLFALFTGGHTNQNPRCIQKPIYNPIFTHNIWSWLLCTPVVLIRTNAICHFSLRNDFRVKGLEKQTLHPTRVLESLVGLGLL